MLDKNIFSSIINNLFEGVILLDKNKSIVFWNKWIEQTSGILAVNAVGKPLLELFSDIQHTRIDTSIDQVVKFGQSSFISHTINPIMLPLYYFKEGAEKTKIYHNIRITALESVGNDFIAMIYISDETGNVNKEQLLRKKALEEKKLNEKLTKEIDERRVIEEKLKLNTLIINNTRDAVVITDSRGFIESINPAFTQIAGFTAEEVVGRHIRILKSGRQSKEFYQSLWDQLNRDDYWKGEFINKKPDDSLIVVESSITAIRNREGKVVNYVSIFRDITQRKKYEEELEIQSRTDPLTGLFNRRTFDETLDLQWRICLHNGSFISVLMIDVDFFKNYNDAYGHQSGDDCLVKIAGVLRSNVRRADDIVARYGGEEFVIVLTNTNVERVNIIAESILSEIRSLNIPHSASGVANHITLSMGIATVIPTINLSPDRLIEIADNALYQAKKNGRNRIVFQHTNIG
jgi:diguanylate cyclase (GGDEF)-like protein/PAS domain S-box-containing protein